MKITSKSDQHKRTTTTKAKLIAVDIEATGLDLNHGCKPFLVSTCTDKGVVKCWEWPVDHKTRQPIVPLKDKLEIKDYLEGAILVFHHGKYDIRAFTTIGIGLHFIEDNFRSIPNVKGRGTIIIPCRTFHDTLLASHACSSSDKHGLKELASNYLGYSADDEKELKAAVALATRRLKQLLPKEEYEAALGYSPTGKRATGADYWLPRFVYDYYVKHKKTLLPEIKKLKDVCLTYAKKDVERTILLWLAFKEAIKELDVDYGYVREKKLLQTVYRMESDGVTVNLKKIKTKKRQLLQKQNTHLDKVHLMMKKHLKRDANVASQNDLPEFLYDKLKLPVVKKTKPKEGSKKKPSPSVDKDALGQLMMIAGDKKGQHYSKQVEHCIKSILLGRSYGGGIKSLNNYIGYSVPHNFQGWATLYPSLNQTGTGTTRFSCSSPNGQNVSKISVIEDSKGRPMLDANGEPLEGPRIRDCFVPSPGKIWYAIDYNQLELRVFSFISNEASLIQALDEGYDFHGYVATRIFNKPIDEISKQERRIAKNVNFAIIFGAGAKKVNETAGIPGAYEMFSGLFPNVASYMKETIAEIRANGYVRTIDGYRLDIPPNEPYKGVNYKAQGGAGSLIKNAMIAIDEKKMVDWENSRLALQIHDELIVEFDRESEQHTPEAVYNIMTAMENAGAEYGINTPVSCERISTDWGHGEEVEVTRKAIKTIKKAA